MATINDAGIPGVGTGILQPKINNRWRVTFANMGGGADSQPVSMQAVKVTRPKLSKEEIELRRYNSVAWVAARHTWDPMTMTIQDDVTGTAGAVIQQQLQKQQWIVGAEGQWFAAAGEGSLYKFASYIDLLDGNDQIIEKWVVEGCWIKEVTWSDLDYSSGTEALTIDITVRFDNANQIIGGYSQGLGVAMGGAGTATL